MMNAEKILILEDHALTRKVLSLALRDLGYHHLFEAISGEQALALLRTEKYFDIVICDIQMQGMDGLSFLREASGVGEISAVAIFSVVESDLSLAIQLFARTSGYQVLGDLKKPFSRGELKSLMAKFQPKLPTNIRRPLSSSLGGTHQNPSLLDGELVPFYQPKIDLRTMRVVGAEVLVRLQHPKYGLISPGEFMDSVIQRGLLDTMTQSLLKKSLRFLREQNLIGELSLSINIEASQLDNLELSETVRQILSNEEVPAQSLTLEVTECGLVQAPTTSIENLVRLRMLGCGISVDDFGAGFSSLQRVCELPCNELKLDASFVRTMTHNFRSKAAVDSMLRLTSQLGISLVAEGIETDSELLLLQDLNCPIGQGYIFSRPLSGEKFIEWLRLHKRYLSEQISSHAIS